MKVLALVEAPSHVCSRYRVGAFAPALAEAGWDQTVEGLADGPLARLRQFARGSAYDCVILQRKLLAGWQLAALRRRARRLVFDFDDAVMHRDSYDLRGPHSPRRSRRFAATVRAADLVVAGNDFRADRAREAGAPADRLRVIPTCVDTARNHPRPDADRRPGLELVWIGSSSTLRGLEQRRDLWDRVAREVPGVRLRVICDRFPDLGAMPVVPVPWSEATEAEAVAGADAGLSWVPDDAWSRGKCGLKVLQYQAAGLPVLANPVGVQAAMVEPGVTGFLADTAGEWVAAAAALAADPGLRGRMGRAARRSVERGYSVAGWGAAVVAAVAGGGSAGRQGPSTRPRLRAGRGANRANG